MKKLRRNIILFLLPFLAGIIGLFFIPVDKNFSYHFVHGECENKASWMYYRMFEDNQSIDVVFSGASQTGCAIMDQTISKELSKAEGKQINAVNFGYCRRGRDIQYVMLKDLFAQKHPKILVLEVAEDEPKKSHPVFPYLAESKDLFGTFVLFNQRYPSAIWKGIVVRFENIRSKFTGNNYSGEKNKLPDFGYRPSTHIVSPEIIAQNRENWKQRRAKDKPEFIRNIELNYSKHYVNKIVKLAGENNCKVLFLYLPESGSDLKRPLLMDYYKQFADVIILPNEIIKDKFNWKDATHFNDFGARKTSEFIVPVLAVNSTNN